MVRGPVSSLVSSVVSWIPAVTTRSFARAATAGTRLRSSTLGLAQRTSMLKG
jgi:hypothetical protein